MIDARCRCGAELTAPGAILFSAPGDGDRVVKTHLCPRCARAANQAIGTDPKRERWDRNIALLILAVGVIFLGIFFSLRAQECDVAKACVGAAR